MVAMVFKNIFLLAGVSGLAASAGTLQPRVNEARAAVAGWMASSSSTASNAALAETIRQWKQLQQSDSYSFSQYADFLLAHPGWPGEKSRRVAAEGAMDNGYSPTLAVQFFTKFPPLSATGRVRYAEALMATGQPIAAAQAARDAWRAGVMRTEDEARLLGAFAGSIKSEDDDARMDALLWQGATTAAQRELYRVSPQRRAEFAARLAFRTNSSDVGQLDSQVRGDARQHAGFIADRATWLRSNGQSPVVRQYLAQPHNLTERPGDAEEWYEVLLANARAAENDGQYQTAYAIASQVDDAYPIATDVSTKSLGERDDYTSLVWLAGTTAFYKLGKPGDAENMFIRYARGSRTPQTQSKGLYWAGRAAEAAGEQVKAKAYYREAAGFPDLYYGQLSTERLGEKLRRPSGDGPQQIADDTRNAFYSGEVVRAAQLLGTQGDWDDQTAFIRQIAADAKSDTDHALAFELSRSLGRPDLGVMVGRSARLNGLTDYTALGYPSVPVPAGYQNDWTMIHAIARQESQFNTAAISHAGARGLMQLMPGTAREAAGKIGLAYSSDSLTGDPQYNIQLGSSYFQRMLSYYGGSYPLAVAAYNAGPGNVNKWIRANGDPRMPGVDMVKWIEDIPIYETKNYVQRVLENAVVYDLMNQQHALSRGSANLSWYLGKNKPG
ncbi:lytic transglycosylase domain-containing protein [Stakelama sp. CBK3Z-3]|uniref:Lytic transglycosylase domain-containing protein n=1 Tax=Stakelama flava TaxID=2860338 RepID=A0ABS6XKZ0_9SPHN|nr:lytic transglycosylase domain-containing protein [Stakelama flava]MBW4330872.1 lytic transglycosylase domain-containing protein [Stakelama flava]